METVVVAVLAGNNVMCCCLHPAILHDVDRLWCRQQHPKIIPV